MALVARQRGGERDRFVAALAEETERNAALATTVERLVRAFDAFDDGVVIVDEHGEPIVRNGAAQRYEGARHSNAVVESALHALISDALSGDSVRRELSVFGPPRQTLLLRAEPVQVHGCIVAAVAWARDISEARRVDETRRDFVANVSHELRTPIGALGLLAETIAGETDPEVMARLAERMVREADRVGRIVDDLLDLSLIEMMDKPVREAVAIRAMVADAVEQVAHAADEAGISVQVDPVDACIGVACDRRQIVSAIYNLLDNAVKYSEPGSVVDVRVATTDDGTHVAIGVHDRGIGIPTRELERVFERFYRVDKARSRATGGTGLGLSIVRHVAHAHGGDVTVQSREGDGSTFTITLPIAKEGAEPNA